MYGAFNLKIKENPRIVGALPDLMLKKWREIEERGGTPVLKKRRYWGVEDEGPGEPLPFMEAPSMAPDDAPALAGPAARSLRSVSRVAKGSPADFCFTCSIQPARQTRLLLMSVRIKFHKACL